MKKKIVSLALVVLLMGLAGLGCYPQEKTGDMETQINKLRNLVEQQKNKIAEQENQIAEQKEQIAGLVVDATKLESQNNTQQSNIKELEGKLGEKDVWISELEKGKTELQAELDKTHQAYQLLKNPSYEELKEFLDKDQIDANEYDSKTYDDLDYARDLKANAEKQGIRVALVLLEFEMKKMRLRFCLNAFETTDKGLIFISPQTDHEDKVAVGINFFSDNGYVPPDPEKWNETIRRVTIVW